ncbi:unnamed protein product [Malus baccata var. baccata]
MYKSQHQNKASAMAVIQPRVDQLEMACQNKMNAQYSQSLTDITWEARYAAMCSRYALSSRTSRTLSPIPSKTQVT